MYKCETCGKEFNTPQKLGGHKSSHNRKEKKIKEPIKICKYCGIFIENPLQLGGHITSCKLNPNYSLIKEKRRESSKNRITTDETKLKISESMKLAHKEKRAWNIGKSRWNNKKSYPEIFFEKVINNEFDDKNYKTEYPIGIYSLDFAWVDKKLGIEIDGEQHDRFEEYKNRDIKKDKLCNEMGWTILRIKWIDLFNHTKEKIKESKDFINNGIEINSEISVYKKQNICCDCGNEIYKTSLRCNKCFTIKNSKDRRKVERPPLDQLLIDIENLGYCGTGRKYGVSDNSIRKWKNKY